MYWIALYVDGRLQRESTHKSDEKQAERFLQKRRNEARAHELNPAMPFISRRQNKRTISDLMDALQSHFEAHDQASAPTLSNINRIRRDFGAKRATSLTAADVNEYIEERQDAGDANATINRTTQLLKQAYKLVNLPLPGPEPITRLDETGNVRTGFFIEPEIRRVLARLSPDLADFVLCGWLTGWRRGEIASLHWTDLDNHCIELRAENAKTGKPRSVPLVGELAELIERRKAARVLKRNGTVALASLIFHRDGEPITEFRKSWHTACVACGLGKWVCPECVGDEGAEGAGLHVFELDSKGKCPRCSLAFGYDDRKYSGRLFHDLRRSAVRDMINAGVPQADAKLISGHKSDSVFDRYNIRDNDDTRRALERTMAYRRNVKENVVAMAATSEMR
jgi:integrase